MNFTRNLISKFALISGSILLSSNRNIFMSQQPVISQLLRGQYENKIRRYSPPQKIFDVFATIRQNGEFYMTLPDLLKAICFYNYSVSEQSQTEGFNPEAILQLLGKKEKFKIYDYFILVRFLAFERKKIQKYFSDNNIRNMNKDEFKKCTQFILQKFMQIDMLQTVCEDSNQFIIPSIGLQSRKFKPKLKNFQQSINQTVQSVFQNKPNGFTLSSLIQFRRHMIRQIFGFQYLMFKHDQSNNIDGTDFARSIIKYVDSSKKKKYMKRIKQFSNDFENIKIGSQAYIGFHYYMQTNISQLEKQLNNHGALNQNQVHELINKYVATGKQISKEQIHIMLKVLDLDDSGFIQKKQFLGVLENLQYYTKNKSGDLTFAEIVKQDIQKITDKAKKIYQILQE